MKKALLYGTAMMFSLAITTSAFAGNDKTDSKAQTAACKDKKACTGKCNGKCTGKCTDKKACAKPESKTN